MAYLFDVDTAPIQPVEEVFQERPVALAALAPSLLDELWSESEAGQWGLQREEFDGIVLLAGVGQNFGLEPGATATAEQQANFFNSVKLTDLVLAKACAAGNERAWEHFLAVYSQPLTRAAIAISGSETVGKDLADAFYAELYGLTTRDGERKCPLDSYRGRGSLIGWLRTTLSQRFVDHYRRTYREESLDEKVLDPPVPDSVSQPTPAMLSRLSEAIETALQGQPAEERFLLAAYYIDGRTLAEIGALLRVHEATISRRLRRITDAVRMQLLRNLEKSGMSRRAAEEALGTDPRDLDLRMNLKKLLQISNAGSFPERAVINAAGSDAVAGALLSDAAEALGKSGEVYPEKAKNAG